MNDKKLLERAAKTLDYKVAEYYQQQGGVWCETLDRRWNPLGDDGDALRLMVDLGLIVNPELRSGKLRGLSVQYNHTAVIYIEDWDGDTESFRRLIVRAAARVGEE